MFQEGAVILRESSLIERRDVAKNRKTWTYEFDEAFRPSVVMGANAIYATDLTGNVRAIDPANGKSIWTWEAGAKPRMLGPVQAIPSNGALFKTTREGIMVMGTPREMEPVAAAEWPTDPEAIRKEIEEIDRQIAEAKKEWTNCKLVLAGSEVSGGGSQESVKTREDAERRIREISEAAPRLKARRAELVKRLR